VTSAFLLSSWSFAAEGPLPDWAQYGLPGLVIIAFLTKQMVPGWLYQAKVKENEALQAEVKRLGDQNFQMGKETAVALQQSSAALSAAIEDQRDRRRQ
jgi:hypothetical protein